MDQAATRTTDVASRPTMTDPPYNIEPLFLMVPAAAKYLGCSEDELLAWIPPDRRLPDRRGPTPNARLWRRTTLDAARPNVEEWRAKDQVAFAAREAARAAILAREEAARARRKGMRKGGALLAGAVCERLACSLTELNRWASDGRLPPDGEIALTWGLPKIVHARAWLPGTLDLAKPKIADWRTQDQVKKIFKRRGLKTAR